MSNKGGYQIIDLMDVGLVYGVPTYIKGSYEAAVFNYRKRPVISGLTLAGVRYTDYTAYSVTLNDDTFEIAGGGFLVQIAPHDIVTVNPYRDPSEPGQSATIRIGETTTLPPGSEATVTNTGTTTDAVLNFGIPTGPTGPAGKDGKDGESIVGPPGKDGVDGKNGKAATIRVGATTTLSPGEPAAVTNVGTTEDAVFNFAIPRGEDGADGIPGKDGEQGPEGPPGPAGKDGEQGPEGPPGPAGKDGTSPTIEIGQTEKLPAGSTPYVVNHGTDENIILDFGIPEGQQGPPGEATGGVVETENFFLNIDISPRSGAGGVSITPDSNGVVSFDNFGFTINSGLSDIRELSAHLINGVFFLQMGDFNKVINGTISPLQFGIQLRGTSMQSINFGNTTAIAIPDLVATVTTSTVRLPLHLFAVNTRNAFTTGTSGWSLQLSGVRFKSEATAATAINPGESRVIQRMVIKNDSEEIS